MAYRRSMTIKDIFGSSCKEIQNLNRLLEIQSKAFFHIILSKIVKFIGKNPWDCKQGMGLPLQEIEKFLGQTKKLRLRKGRVRPQNLQS